MLFYDIRLLRSQDVIEIREIVFVFTHADCESWKTFILGVKRLKVKVTSHKNIAGVGLCTLVRAGFL